MTDETRQKTSMSFIERITASKQPLIGTILTIASTTIPQLVGLSDSDVTMIDMEHAPLPIDIVTQMVHAFTASSRGKGVPLIRVPSHGVEWIKWSLDSGAAGIVVPMVDNAEQMSAIIDRAVYPPVGRRSYGPIYAQFAHPDGANASGGMAGYFESATRGDIAILPMIESKEGLADVEDIVSMEGVSGVLIGPADLRLSLGLPVGIDGSEAEFEDALEKIYAAGKQFGKVVGVVALGEEAVEKRAAEGADFILSAFDMGSLMSGLTTELAMSRKAVAAGLSKA